MRVRGLIAEVNNVPHPIIEPGYLVVRRDEHNASLWYYGFYRNIEQAYEAAVEIGNGIVLEVSEEEV